MVLEDRVRLLRELFRAMGSAEESLALARDLLIDKGGDTHDA